MPGQLHSQFKSEEQTKWLTAFKKAMNGKNYTRKQNIKAAQKAAAAAVGIKIPSGNSSGSSSSNNNSSNNNSSSKKARKKAFMKKYKEKAAASAAARAAAEEEAAARRAEEWAKGAEAAKKATGLTNSQLREAALAGVAVGK